MKTQTLALLLFAAFAVNAQTEVEIRYSYPEWEVYKNKPNGEKHTVSVYSGKGKRRRIENSFSFNSTGQVERECFYKRNGNILKETLFTYNDSAKMTSRKVILNNKLRNVYRYHYTNYTLLSSNEVYFKDTVTPISTTTYEYVLGNKMKTITGFDGDRNKTYRYEYTYDEQGNKTETKYYKREKLKHHWLYECDPKGELSGSKTVKICKNRVYASDGSFTEVFENTSKGKVHKTIIRSAADGRVLESEKYDAKGVLQTRSVYQYNDAKQLVRYSKYKGNSTQAFYVELYEYANDLSLTASTHLDKKGSVTWRREFSYN